MRIDAAEAAPLDAGAEVGVVHADIEDVVPHAGGLGGGAADEDGAAVDVVHLRVAIVLAAVDLAIAALACDGFAEAEDASGRPQPLPVAVEVTLGAHAADAGVRLGYFDQLGQHGRLDLDVVVEQQHIVVAVVEGPAEAGGVARGAAAVDLHPDLPQLRKRSGEGLWRAVGRGVVEHDEIEVGIVHPLQAFDGLHGDLPAVVVDDDDGDARGVLRHRAGLNHTTGGEATTA